MKRETIINILLKEVKNAIRNEETLVTEIPVHDKKDNYIASIEIDLFDFEIKRLEVLSIRRGCVLDNLSEELLFLINFEDGD